MFGQAGASREPAGCSEKEKLALRIGEAETQKKTHTLEREKMGGVKTGNPPWGGGGLSVNFG